MRSNNVAAAAAAAATSRRVVGATRAVAVTGSVDFALDDDAILTVMAVDEQSQDGSDEEEDDVHDSKSPSSLEHGTLTVDVQAPSVSSDGEQAQVGAVDSGSAPV